MEEKGVLEWLTEAYGVLLLGGGVLTILGVIVWALATGTWTGLIVLVIPFVWLLMWLFP